MSQIKLTADSGGGTTSLKAPSSTTSNADVVLKLPVADGSANQVLKTDGSGQLSFTSNAGTTINNNADNRIITGSGTASTLNGESSLTYDSGGMSITGDTDRDGIKITQSGNNYGEFMFNSNRSSSGNALGIIRGEWNSTEVASIYLTAGSDTTNKDDGQIKFFTSPDSGTGIQTRMTIDKAGNVGIGTTDPAEILHIKEGTNKNLHFTGGIGQIGNVTGFYAVNDANSSIVDIGMTGSTVRFGTTAGERGRFTGDGLCFNGDTAAANALDDYEEGTYTISDQSGNGITYTANSTTKYVKIGQLVYVQIDVTLSNCNNLTTQDAAFSLPFTLGHNYGSGVVGWTDHAKPCQIHIGQSKAYIMDCDGNTSIHIKNSELNNKRFIANFHYLTAT